MDVNEILANAELAIENGQNAVALDWLRKALELEPENLEALSRAGAVGVALQQFGEALDYFQKAKELDPTNGDNHFNLGNAYFFHNEHAKAFECFVEAERLGCSADVLIQLNYQMMIMSTLRLDLDSARIYMQKIEDLDVSGTIALSPDFISEKLKLEMLCENYDGALKYAAQMVSIEPAVFRHYAVYFSLLMAQKDYETAEIVLNQAERYAARSELDGISLASQKAGLYLALSEEQPEEAEKLFDQAVEALKPWAHREDLEQEQRELAITTLCDVYCKSERFGDAVTLAGSVLGLDVADGSVPSEEDAGAIEEPVVEVPQLDAAQLSAMLSRDLERLNHCAIVDSVAYPRMAYDSDGDPVGVFSEAEIDALTAALAEPKAEQVPESEMAPPSEMAVSEETRNKLYFTLVTCYLAWDDFGTASQIASVLKHSDNRYYSYYGLYVETMASRHGDFTAEESRQMYDKAIGYFRNRVVEDRKDSLAAVFRARLYAEIGKYEQAEQVAALLSQADREAVERYIEQLKQS